MPTVIDPRWISGDRLASYLRASEGDVAVASALYEWNARACGALFEVVHHFEVLLRNAVVEELAHAGQSAQLPPGSPWIQGVRQIEEVAARLTRQHKEPTAARVYAGLSFGFWQNLFSGASGEALWRHALQYVFRHSRADRPIIAAYLESVNQLRNTIAHHGSLIDLDILVEVQKLIRLAGWIDPRAADWLRSTERVSEVARGRPVQPRRNVVVVSAASAWPLYDKAKQYAYILPAARSIKVVEYIAFYADQEIKPVVPRILRRFDAIDWNRKNAKRLGRSTDPHERALTTLIPASIDRGWHESLYQVFILSGPTDQETERLTHAVGHSARGAGSAFVRSHRYVALSELKSALDTAEMAKAPT